MSTRPGRRASATRSWNSVGVRSSRSPAALARIAGTSISRSATCSTSSATLGALGAAQHGAHPGDELPGAEGLDHVVVGAELEADDAVGLVVARREHDDRQGAEGAHARGSTSRPSMSGSPRSRTMRSGLVARTWCRAFSPSLGDQYGKAGVLEVVAHEARDLRVVFDDEDGLHGASIPSPGRPGWASGRGWRGLGGRGGRRRGRAPPPPARSLRQLPLSPSSGAGGGVGGSPGGGLTSPPAGGVGATRLGRDRRSCLGRDLRTGVGRDRRSRLGRDRWTGRRSPRARTGRFAALRRARRAGMRLAVPLVEDLVRTGQPVPQAGVAGAGGRGGRASSRPDRRWDHPCRGRSRRDRSPAPGLTRHAGPLAGPPRAIAVRGHTVRGRRQRGRPMGRGPSDRGSRDRVRSRSANSGGATAARTRPPG